jgi:hypothetical protein
MYELEVPSTTKEATEETNRENIYGEGGGEREEEQEEQEEQKDKRADHGAVSGGSGVGAGGDEGRPDDVTEDEDDTDADTDDVEDVRVVTVTLSTEGYIIVYSEAWPIEDEGARSPEDAEEETVRPGVGVGLGGDSSDYNGLAELGRCSQDGLDGEDGELEQKMATAALHCWGVGGDLLATTRLDLPGIVPTRASSSSASSGQLMRAPLLHTVKCGGIGERLLLTACADRVWLWWAGTLQLWRQIRFVFIPSNPVPSRDQYGSGNQFHHFYSSGGRDEVASIRSPISGAESDATDAMGTSPTSPDATDAMQSPSDYPGSPIAENCAGVGAGAGAGGGARDSPPWRPASELTSALLWGDESCVVAGTHGGHVAVYSLLEE